MTRLTRALLLLVWVLTACSGFLDSGTNPPPPPGTPMLSLVGNFTEPVYLAAAPGDSARLFVVERGGTIRVLHHDTTQLRPVLDLSGQVQTGFLEQGLLSIAFDPQYAANGRFFVYFTNPAGDIRIVRYNVSATDADSADEATADTVLAVAHPGQANHNGGQLQFGPDSMLWTGTGDGGGGGDPTGNAQNRHALLGKLLRLDVSGTSGYAIPADNPANADTSFALEVWSYGLRNPWRFSFDRVNGDLYIGDVGQNRYEEVDVSPTAVRGRAVNFGWNIMEGNHCYPSDPCTAVGQLPVVEYPHFAGACSITGGYVYRGSALPALAGNYFYADYCTGSIHSIKYPATSTGDWTSILSPSGGNISSFGQDARGELYVLQLTGPVWRIIPTP
jgi:glucose/arabinose dehydrogenase